MDLTIELIGGRAKQFEESFSLLKAAHRDIPASRGRASLQASWSFKFVEPETATLLPTSVLVLGRRSISQQAKTPRSMRGSYFHSRAHPQS